MSTESKLRAGLELVRVGLDAARGNIDPPAMGRAVLDAALEFIPVEDLRAHLDAAAEARAERAADEIVERRFPQT